MGNGYFRTSQTRKDKRRTKELTYNYVDRVRLAEHSLQHDYKCPTRGSGWRHNSNNNNNKSISHLDLATSCHGAASGANHWSHAHQLRHSRSLDYNHIGERRQDALDIAEFYWRLDPEADVPYDDDVLDEQRNGVDLRQHEPQLYRDYNYADENYYAGNYKNSNSIYQQQQHTAANLSSALQAFDFGNESCSLRRSRSLAVIREETFSDLQITSANSSRRRSQLIPRARIVNRGFIRERERLICANNKHHHHHHDGVAAREVLASNGDEQELSDSVGGGTASTCDSHKQQQLQLQQHRHHHHHNQHYIHQQQQQSSHSSAHRQQQHPQSREADDYYDNLKRLDALALGLAEQLHPWHNDKSDLESLNSDYFKNSLHQSHELKQQLDFEALEQAVSFLAGEKPRIYQSRRQQRVGGHAERLPIAQQKLQIAGDSYPENSQSSAFPETTTSNSDDQTDSPSLSEQEYDLKQIETIYKETQLDDDEEGYELISLTTTTRTRIETTEDEDEDEENEARAACKAAERHTSDTEVEFAGGTLKRTRALSENLEKLIAYDSVYLSSEEGSESTFIGENTCEAFERTTHLTAQLEDDGVETSTLLRFSIEDIIYEPQAKQHKVERELAPAEERTKYAEIFEQIRDAEQTTVNVVETLSGRVEKTEKIATTFEKLAVKSAELASESLAPTLYTQILKVGHTTSTTTVPAVAAVANVPKAVSSNTPTPTVGITSSAASKPKILSVVEKRKWKRYTDANSCHNHTNSNEATQRDLSNAVAPTAHSNGEHPYTQLKRQATADSLTYLPFKANLSDNQYHSLPDVNIGQSLKVSECIDAKLRSSYNLHKYQRAAESDAALVDCSLREAKTAATALLENGEQREGAVTSEEIYDSITRFGRAHQKARQKEYEELNEALGEQEKLAKRECKEKRIKLEANETLLEPKQATLTAVTTQTPQEYEEIQGSEQVAATEAGSGEIVAELVDESEELSDSLADTQVIGEPIAEQSTDDTQSHNEEPLEFGETPKSAPDIEVANFSKLIERRAKEIKEYAKRQRTLPKTLTDGCGGSAKQPSERQRNKSKEAGSKLAECPAASSAVGEESATSAAFRIIVTDAQNNIIEEDSIVEIAAKGERETSSGANAWGENSKQGTREKLRELQKETTNTPTWPKCEQISHVTAAITSSNNELHYSSNNNSVKSNTKSTHHAHNRVTTLKRVPSKPKRQQHHQHLHALQGSCCQQQQPDNTASSNNTADSNNSCGTAPGKSKERRVLSTQIYKARPVKVLTNSDSFRRRSGSKMSRPQILHVVDNKRKCDMLGMGNNNNNDSDGSAKVADCQAESEYLKKVDAVRSYWSKLAKDEADRQQQAEEAARAAADEPECERQQPNLRNRKHSSELENCIEPRRQTPSQQQPQQLVEQNQQQTRQAAEQEPPQILQSAQQQKPRPEPRHFILGAPVQPKPSTAAAADNNHNTGNNTRSPDDFCSFMPSIEIVELDGDKTATIVSAAPPDAAALCNDASEPQFDHIRYKVLKSQQLIRSNILARNKKEAQFDGLIQYLQDYSFQELLSNNNVVIVEPVRTKIERPLTMAPTTAANVGHGTAATGATAAKATPTAVTNHQPKASGQKAAASGANAASRQHAGSSVGGGGGIKRHFFYQPVRVNRELYEEELPNPDVVRNVRKFFEQHILPTPGRGMLVRRTGDSAQKVDDSAVTLQQQQQQQRHHQQQPSPRTRRARKYRYLTIDTSYGHAATQHSKQQQQQQPTAAARKWDTASLSSGISSGDLSSPCDCNDPDASHAPPSPAAPDQAQEMANALKDVHVQEVVQRHNSCQQRTANSNGDSATFHVAADGGRAGTRPQPRPRSAVGGALADAAEGAYCQRAIYDYNRPAYYAAAAADSGRFADDADDDDVEDEYEDADMDDELGESYYVSNDVLEKIRECGSSVTYYGGRVLQCSSPDPQLWCGNSAVPSNNNGAQQTANNMTLTRRRARQIETCSVCQPNECPHKQQLQQRFSARAHEQQAPKSEGVDVDKQLPHSAANSEMATTHYGIKFKLVKSNSCSSRLELAGAGAVVLTADAMKTEPQPETEVVRKMVHHFESNKQPAAVKKANGENVALEELLTINSQTPAREPDGSSGGGAGTGANGPTKQVTVNNHINVPAMGQPTAVAATLPKMPSHHSNTPTDKQQAADVGGKTYQSSALDIRLSCGAPEKPHECGSADGVGAATKIWRNKNVDLAYTMAKQQQQPKPAKALAASRNDNQSETLHMARTPTATAKPNTAAQTHNCAAPALVVSRTLQTNLPLSSAAPERVDVAAARRTQAGAQATGGGEFKRLENTKSQLTTTENQMPAQIVVPVEIHRVDTDAAKRAPLTPSSSNSNIAAAAPAPAATTTTTTATLVDKSVVRHYVANDKSLFEKRKYDDIEFEEFEVYDPTKDLEKLIESGQEQEGNAADAQQQLDVDAARRGRSAAAIDGNSHAVSDFSTPHKAAAVSGERKQHVAHDIRSGADEAPSRGDSDCYDSLEDKL